MESLIMTIKMIPRLVCTHFVHCPYPWIMSWIWQHHNLRHVVIFLIFFFSGPLFFDFKDSYAISINTLFMSIHLWFFFQPITDNLEIFLIMMLLLSLLACLQKILSKSYLQFHSLFFPVFSASFTAFV